jgi:hypothetical protein
MTTGRSPRSMQRTQRLVVSAIVAISAVMAASVFWPHAVLSHGTVTTTVLFDREIVRILDKHCVMCHAEGGPSFPLETYEQTWVQGRKIRAGVLARHMPPWGAVPGYGRFINDNSLTLRETQFIVSWVEGLGPRNAGTVFTNVADPGGRPGAVRAQAHTSHWRLGEPDLIRELAGNTIGPGQANEIRRTVIDLALESDRRLGAVEYVPGDRRVVRAAFFTVQETGQWIGSWTPWFGPVQLPAGAAYRLPAGSHIVAEIHYRGANEAVEDRGMLGLFFADQPPSPGFGAPRSVSDLVLEAEGKVPAGGAAQRLRAETRLPADTYAISLRPEVAGGVKTIEVSARKPDGGTDILLFAKDLRADWPTPYIFTEPVLLRRGTMLSVTAYSSGPLPGKLRLTVSRY